MKQLIFIVGLLTFFSTCNLHAQDSLATYKKWSIGVKAGPTFSFVTATDEAVVRRRPNISLIQGISYGGVLRYMTEKNFGLQIEANYVEKGWKEILRNAAGERDPSLFYQVNLDYIEVPLLAYGYFGKRNVKIFLTLGMYGALLLSHDTETAPQLDLNEITYEYLVADQNTFDLGIRGGGGFAVATKVGTFQLEGTYSLGLNSVMDRLRTSIPSIIQNHTITVSLGYLIQF